MAAWTFMGAMLHDVPLAMPTIRPDAKQRIDEYIADAPAFAQPICKKLRKTIKQAHPEIVEDWKWGPNFNKNGMVCGFGAFKAHVTLVFFQGVMMSDKKQILAPCSDGNARSRSLKFTSAKEIDEKVLAAYVKEAVSLNDKGVKGPARRATIPTPPDLTQALARNKRAKAFFDDMTPGYRRDFVDWVTSAKRAETRAERVSATVKLCAEHKHRHWKYESQKS
jgi:uncharacterized protein YdeI (YjbR/CyaY-like superfamily)